MKGKKTGGRSKGAENVLTKTAREMFVLTLENQVPFIEKALNDVRDGVLDPKDKDGKKYLREPDPVKYLDLYAKYAQYFVPKKVEQHNTHEFPDKIKISVK